MTTPHRSRILGDLDENAPERWEWGSPSGPQIDLALLLYARDDAGLQRLEEEQARGLAAGGLALRHRLGTSDLDDFEPFGFRDGISQPFVEGLSKTGPPETTVRAGEFVLGYPNEYGLYTGRPLLDAAADPHATLPRDAEGSGRADLGRNGSYLVLRQLRQDVPGFWRYLDGVTRRADGTSDPQARLRLASKMVGRWPSGAPLTLAPDADDPSLAERERLRLPRARPARSPLPGRLAHPPLASARLARPAAGEQRLLGDQPPPPHPAARPRVRDVADDRRGARRRRHDRARPELHLPEREHPAPVRVHQPHLAEQPEVRRALRRRRSRRRAVGAVRRDVHDPDRRRPRARDEHPALRLGEGRRLLLPARPRGGALPGGDGRRAGELLVARRLVVLDRRSSAAVAATARSTCASAPCSGCRAGGARRSSATGCRRAPARSRAARASRTSASGSGARRPARAARASSATARRCSRSASGTDRSGAAGGCRTRRPPPPASATIASRR